MTLPLLGCGSVPYKAGSDYTAPISAPLNRARINADSVLVNGARPGDVKVKSIVKDLGTAQAAVVVVTKQVDTLSQQNAKSAVIIAADKKRIYTDDFIFAIPILIIGGMMFFNIAKVMAL